MQLFGSVRAEVGADGERVGIEQLHRAVPFADRDRLIVREVRDRRAACAQADRTQRLQSGRRDGPALHLVVARAQRYSPLAVAPNRDAVDASWVSEHRRTDRRVIGD